VAAGAEIDDLDPAEVISDHGLPAVEAGGSDRTPAI